MTNEHPLIEARKSAKMSRDSLASIVGVTRVTIWRIENKQATPSLELVARIIAALRTRGVELSADAFLPSPATASSEAAA